MASPQNSKIAENHIVRVTIVNTGGEFTGGIVNDPGLKKNIKERIKEHNLSSSMEFDDDSFFESSEHISILSAYGPNVPGSQIIVELSSDTDIDDDYEREYEEIISETIGNTGINCFTSSNPFPDEDSLRKGADDDLIFYSQKIEKRISYPVVLDPTLDDRIKLENLYIGSMNMDETMSQDEIAQ